MMNYELEISKRVNGSKRFKNLGDYFTQCAFIIQDITYRFEDLIFYIEFSDYIKNKISMYCVPINDENIENAINYVKNRLYENRMEIERGIFHPLIQDIEASLRLKTKFKIKSHIMYKDPKEYMYVYGNAQYLLEWASKYTKEFINNYFIKEKEEQEERFKKFLSVSA